MQRAGAVAQIASKLQGTHSMLFWILCAFVFCFVLERLLPGWHLPAVKSWPARVIAVNTIQLGVVVLAGLTWERWLSNWSVFSLSA